MSMLKNYSDEDLVELMKMAISDSLESEYAEAFTTLYERRKDFIFLHCRKFTKAMKLTSKMDEEIFSEFFLNLRSKISRFDPSKSSSKKPFLAWALRVLRNIAIDAYRSQQNHETHLSEEEWDGVSLIEENDLPSELPSTPEGKAIQAALNNLNERDREIVLEYARQRAVNSSQRSPKGIYEEIGVKFGTSGENVKMIYKRFRQTALQSQVPQ